MRLSLFVLIVNEGTPLRSDLIEPIRAIDSIYASIFDPLLQISLNGFFSKGGTLSSHIKINIRWLKRYINFCHETKNRQFSVLLRHYNVVGGIYLNRHRNVDIGTIPRQISECLCNCLGTWTNFITSGPDVLANDCPSRVRVTKDGNGPCGPAVVEPKMQSQPHDRARKYDAGPQRTAESPDDCPEGRDTPVEFARHTLTPRARATRSGGASA